MTFVSSLRAWLGKGKRQTLALQVLYVVLGVGTYAYVLYVAHARLPPAVPLPRVRLALLGALLLLALASYALACTADPGFVSATTAAHYARSYARNAVLDAAPQPCTACGATFVPPPRTHHCSVCGRCVARRVGHSASLGRCVGERNLRWALLALALGAALAVATAHTALALVVSAIRAEHAALHSALFAQHTVPGALAAIVSCVWHATGALPLVAVGAGAAALALVMVFAELARGALRNVTPAEARAARDVRAAARLAARGEAHVAHARFPDLPVLDTPYVHAYDRGTWNNLLEVIFPPCCQHTHSDKFE